MTTGNKRWIQIIAVVLAISTVLVIVGQMLLVAFGCRAVRIWDACLDALLVWQTVYYFRLGFSRNSALPVTGKRPD